MENTKRKTKKLGGRRRNSRQTNDSIPAAVGTSVSAKQPAFQSRRSTDGRITIVHRELIASVSTATTFAGAVKSFDINPGLGGTFPWLSSISRAYENYQFKRLKFIYEPACGTTTSGALYMAIDFDAQDDNPASESELASYHGSTVSPVYHTAVVSADRDSLERFKTQRYMRYLDMPDADIKTYDLGTLFLAAIGTGVAVVGNVFAEYTVEFMVPQRPDWIEATELSAKISGSPTVKSAPFAGCASSNANFVVGDDDSGTANNTIRFKNPGEYLIELFGGGTTVSDTLPLTSIAKVLNGDASATLQAVLTATQHNTAGNTFAQSYRIKTYKPNTGFSLDETPVMAAINGLQARIGPYGYSQS